MIDISLNNIITLKSYKKLNNYYNKLHQCSNSVVYFDNSNNKFSDLYKKCKELFKNNELLTNIEIKQQVYTLSLSAGLKCDSNYYCKDSLVLENLLYKNNNNTYLNNILKLNSNFIIISLNIYNGVKIVKEKINDNIIKYKTQFVYPTNYKIIINSDNIYYKNYYKNKKSIVLNTKILSDMLIKIKNDKLKKIIIELLYDICKINNDYLAKDIKEMLLNNEIILPIIDLLDINNYYNKKDLFLNKYKNCEKFNYNKYNINFSYLFNKIYKYIKNTQVEKFKIDLNNYFKNNSTTQTLLSLNYKKIYNLIYSILYELYFKKKILIIL